MNHLSVVLTYCLMFLCICCGSKEAQAAAHFVKYLHVEANEGDSSGGHTAIRFDNETFHFQHDSSGIIRIQRLDSQTFDHIYADLGNRGIRESWIEVSEESYKLLLDGFNQVLFIQDEQLRILASLRRDVTLFEILLNRLQPSDSSKHPADFPLKGLGYFWPDDQNSAAVESAKMIRPPSPALGRLKSLVNNSYGESFVEQRITQAHAAIHNLKLNAAPSRDQNLSLDIFPKYSDSASSTYTDALLALSALQVLQAEKNLLPGSYWSPSSDSFKLSPEESLFLRTYADKLTNNLLNLLNSTRSDWGFPFIVGMARLASIEISVNSGRFVFLDVFSGTTGKSRRQEFSGRQYLPAMIKETAELFSMKQQEFFSGREMREADYAALELLGNKLMELEYAITYDVQPRPLPETPAPSRSAQLRSLAGPDMSEADLQRELEAARKTENAYAKALANLYEYNLFQRNCVTEIFFYINRILTRSAATNENTGLAEILNHSQHVRAESQQRLGGYIDPAQGLNFIPVISMGEVDACYRVTAKRELSSYRAAQLARMKKRESPLLVFLRESNTITSTIYRRAPDDSPFLFFTEDTFLLRPVYGAFNLLAGLGESLLGLATMPFEGTRRFHLGAKGVLFSLPELIFINLRKGTIEYVAASR